METHMSNNQGRLRHNWRDRISEGQTFLWASKTIQRIHSKNVEAKHYAKKKWLLRKFFIEESNHWFDIWPKVMKLNTDYWQDTCDTDSGSGKFKKLDINHREKTLRDKFFTTLCDHSIQRCFFVKKHVVKTYWKVWLLRDNWKRCQEKTNSFPMQLVRNVIKRLLDTLNKKWN